MAIIQSLPFGGSGSSYTNMTAEEAIAGTNTEERVVSAKVLNDAIDNKIPKVNNATLTIQKNGTTVKTFTANASSNVTCNITVPTKISDLTNDSGFIADVSNKADKATTLSGYGIADAYTKTQVDNKISDLVNSAPETLDTLNELAQALGNDPNFATTIAGQIGSKANDSDVVHKSGNETIDGVKTFNDGIISNVTGKGALSLQSKSGTSRIYLRDNVDSNYPSSVNLYSKVGDNPEYGVYLIGNTFHPNISNVVNLGTASYKWKDVYATTLHGDVDFPITEAQITAIVV